MSCERLRKPHYLMVTLVTIATDHLKDTKIKDRLLQVIILLNFDLSRMEHLGF